MAEASRPVLGYRPILAITPLPRLVDMSMPDSPYSAFSALINSFGHKISPAELHGLLLGRSCAGAGFEPEPWLEEVAEVLGAPVEDAFKQALIGLQEMVKAELTGDDMAMVLLLPGDDGSLKDRAVAMSQWCQGFLGGFGVAAGDRALSGDAMEVLEDLAAIAQVQSALEESEDGENDYMEVMEYLRVAPLLLFTECNKAPTQPAEKPSLH